MTRGKTNVPLKKKIPMVEASVEKNAEEVKGKGKETAQIIVTPGETALIEAFKGRSISIETENLLVGDIHIRKGDTTVYIFERKAKGDLDASIKDGRYREQKNRLIETGVPRKNIIYLIEQLTRPNVRVWSAMCNSQHRDGFSVFQTKNVGDTVNYLVGMRDSVSKFKGGETVVDSENINIQIKKKQVSSNDWFKYSLTLIPRVSLGVAEVIVYEYPGIRDLVTAIKEEGPKCLEGLRHGESKRRVGKILSEQICKTIIENY